MTDIILFDFDEIAKVSDDDIIIEMTKTLIMLKNLGFTLGLIGENICKFRTILSQFTYIFSEAGSVIYKFDDVTNSFYKFWKHNIVNYLGSHLLKKLGENFLYGIKNDNFIYTLNKNQYYDVTPLYIEILNGSVYFYPIGKTPYDYQQQIFLQYDESTHWTQYMCDTLSILDNRLVFKSELDGTIKCCPREWNSSQIVPQLKVEGYTKIYYFGKKTDIYKSPHVIGFVVKDYKDIITNIDFLLPAMLNK